jgi:tetratricopeptide (TPR) repeat protein
MGWIDYFVDQERFVLDTLLQLNTAERTGFEDGIVRGQMAFGVILDHLPLVSVSRIYHHNGVRQAEATGHPVSRAFAYFGLGMHEHHALGHLDVALDHYRKAAELWWASGDLRRWGAAVYSLAWVLRVTGDLAGSFERGAELARVGEAGADHHVLAWGLHTLGRTRLQAGAVDEAADHLRRAITLFAGVPDHQFAQCATSDLAHCDMRRGNLQAARARLEESRAVIASRRFRGFLCASTWVGLAELAVRSAEGAAGPEHRAALRRARRACRGALRQSARTPEAAAAAARLRGTLEWLAHHRRRARRWWAASLAAGTRLGARQEVGLTHLEIGRRIGDRPSLERAAELFAAIGADGDLQSARACPR